jgi:hypothetical protein
MFPFEVYIFKKNKNFGLSDRNFYFIEILDFAEVEAH